MKNKRKITLWIVLIVVILVALLGYLSFTKKIQWFTGGPVATEQPLPINNTLKTSVTVLPKAE